MLQFTEDAQQFCLEYRSHVALAITLGGLAVAVLALVAGPQRLGAAVAVGFMAWASAVVYERSRACFDARTRRVQGVCQRFRQTQRFELPFADIAGLAVEHTGQNRYRITLLTPSGAQPLLRTFAGDAAVREQALRLQAWLQRQGVSAPLQERRALTD